MSVVAIILSIKPHPRLAITVDCEAARAEYLFVEKRDQLDGVGRGAVAAVIVLDGICDMVFMVG